MKLFLFLILAVFCFSFSGNAQNSPYKVGETRPLVTLDFKILDTSNNQIFTNHPKIENISVYFKDNHPELIYVHDSPRDVLYYEII